MTEFLFYLFYHFRACISTLCTRRVGIPTLPAAGIFLALEFALDKLDVNDWILYGVYAAALAGYIALGLRMFFRKNPQAAERESVP